MSTYYCPECKGSSEACVSRVLHRDDYVFEEAMERMISTSFKVHVTMVSYKEEIMHCIACDYPIVGRATAQVTSAFGGEELSVSRKVHFMSKIGREVTSKYVGRDTSDTVFGVSSDNSLNIPVPMGQSKQEPGLGGLEIRSYFGESWGVMASLDDESYICPDDVCAIWVKVHVGDRKPDDWESVEMFDEVYVFDKTKYICYLKEALWITHPQWCCIQVYDYASGVSRVYGNELRGMPL